MPKVTNITGAPMDLRVPGFEAVVEPGETVDAPDFQPDGESPIVYSDELWETVGDAVVEPEPDAVPDTADTAEPAAEPADTTEQAAE